MLRTAIASVALVVAVGLGALVSRGEIDVTRLVAAHEGTPRITLEDGKIANSGDAAAENIEVVSPQYRLLGNLAPGATIEAPGTDFAIRYEFIESGRRKSTERRFRVASPAAPRPAASKNPSRGEVLGSSLSGLPEGLRASYDPARHLLTISADRVIEVWTDGFLLRPVARTTTGEEFRYVPSNTLVLGQSIARGEAISFEVVFTRPQDFYSIPLYAREPGRPPVYFVVSIGLAATQAEAEPLERAEGVSE